MDYAQYVREQVSEADWQLLEKLGVNLDTKALAKIWPDFVNHEKRQAGEIPFLLEQLAGIPSPRVFDASLGSGATSIGLKKAGIEVVSNDIDDDLIRIARDYAKLQGVELDVTTYDWRDLPYEQEFDCVACLGNSATELFKREDLLSTFRNFRKSLKPGRPLIVDERNYGGRILRGDYTWSGDFVYCGKDKVDARPVHISDSIVVIEYGHEEMGVNAHLVMYPFKAGELEGLLREADFKEIRSFGDYRKDFKPEEPEFITHVALA